MPKDIYDEMPLQYGKYRMLFKKNRNPIIVRRKSLSFENERNKRGASHHIYLEGSLTLEMVVILPLFISFMVFFLFLFRVLEVQICIEEALQYTSRSVAASCYRQTKEENSSEGVLLAKSELIFLEKLRENNCPEKFIKGGNTGISLLTSDFSGDEICLNATWHMTFPVAVFGEIDYFLISKSQSRKWIGNTTLQSEEADSEWVFITPEGRAYHRGRDCNYLDLSIRSAKRTQVGTLRNGSGRKYTACESCYVPGSNTVLVTDYGDCFHSSLSCGGLKRTIYMVRISEVGNRHACSKCMRIQTMEQEKK